MNKQGQVLVYGNYTPLLEDRTIKRHVYTIFKHPPPMLKIIKHIKTGTGWG
jgi:hypothetical protein